MHIAQDPATNLAQSPPNRVRLVCHSLDSAGLRDPLESRLFTQSWNNLRQHGHAPVLVYRSTRNLGDCLLQMEDSGLVRPEFIICGLEHLVYDDSRKEILTTWPHSDPAHEDWALQWLLETLGIPASAMLVAGNDFYHNQDLIDRMIAIEDERRQHEEIPPS